MLQDMRVFPIKILKHCVNLTNKTFIYTCNSSLISRIYPDRCKYAVAWTIYKKGDKTNISNYRPISLLLQSSKVPETLTINRLNQYLNWKNFSSRAVKI